MLVVNCMRASNIIHIQYIHAKECNSHALAVQIIQFNPQVAVNTENTKISSEWKF